MNPINAKRAGILGMVLAILLGRELSAQVVPADRLVLPPTTSLGDGAVYMGRSRILHAWDWNLANTGPTNTFLGIGAGNLWTPADPNTWGGHFNTAVGVGALNHVQIGMRNTGVGAHALFGNTQGSGNTAVGADALFAHQTGDHNTAVGDSALGQSVMGEYNHAFGTAALIYNSGSMNAAFGGLWNNTTGSYNTGFGVGSLLSNSTGWGNTAVGLNSLVTNHEGFLNTVIGYQADIGKDGYVNATAIGANAVATDSNMVRIGDSAVTVIEGQVPFSWVSDRRWKKDIATLELGLELVRKLRPVSYRLKNGNDRLDMGFVAQEVEELLGHGYNAVSAGGDEEHLLSMRYTDLIAPLVRAVQEVDQQCASSGAALRGDNAALQAEIAELRRQFATASRADRARIERLERALRVVLASAAAGDPSARSATVSP